MSTVKIVLGVILFFNLIFVLFFQFAFAKKEACSVVVAYPTFDYHQVFEALRTQMKVKTDMAEDATQEAILRFYREIQRGNTIRNPENWLIYAGKRILLDMLKSSYGRKSVFGTELNWIKDRHSLEAYENEEASKAWNLGGPHLTESDRTLLTQHYIDGLDISTLARNYKAKDSAIQMRLSRARARLKRIIEEKSLITPSVDF